MTSSACSAVRPSMNSWAATRLGSEVAAVTSSGGTASAATVRSQALCCRAGSWEITQVSLLVPPPWLETTPASGVAPTRVSPPGRTV